MTNERSDRSEAIDARATVRVTLNGLGLHAVREYLDEPRRDIRGPRTMCMPLWEALKILGPHSKSSMRCPIDEIEFDRPESRAERQNSDTLLAFHSHAESLRGLLRALGFEGSKRSLTRLAGDYVDGAPCQVPDGAGWWWLGEDVVRVVWAVGLHPDDDGERLDAILRNNHHKPVRELDGWCGPAIRDPRLVVRVDDEADEDIPF